MPMALGQFVCSIGDVVSTRFAQIMNLAGKVKFDS